MAAPGKRIHDVAHMCWQYPGLGRGVTNVAEAARQLKVICDAYRLSDRGPLIDTILWWQDPPWRLRSPSLRNRRRHAKGHARS